MDFLDPRIEHWAAHDVQMSMEERTRIEVVCTHNGQDDWKFTPQVILVCVKSD